MHVPAQGIWHFVEFQPVIVDNAVGTVGPSDSFGTLGVGEGANVCTAGRIFNADEANFAVVVVSSCSSSAAAAASSSSSWRICEQAKRFTLWVAYLGDFIASTVKWEIKQCCRFAPSAKCPSFGLGCWCASVCESVCVPCFLFAVQEGSCESFWGNAWQLLVNQRLCFLFFSFFFVGFCAF